jgi:hypothetical protein
MANIVIVKSKKNNGKAFIVDLDDFRNVYIDTNRLKEIDGYNSETNTFKDDKYNINECYGTLAFVNKKEKFYGVLKDRNGALSVTLVTFKTVEENPEEFNKYSNINGKLVDITQYGLDVLKKQFWKEKISNSINSVATIKSLSRQTMCKVEDFIEMLKQQDEATTIKNKEETKINSEPAVDKKEEFKQTIEEKPKPQAITSEIAEDKQPEIENNNEKHVAEETKKEESSSVKDIDTLSKILDSIESRLSEVISREKVLDEREKELIDKSSKLNKMLARAEASEVGTVTDTILNVDNIFKINETPTDLKEQPDYIYEMILKVLNTGDMITLPLSYFSKIKCYMVKNLEANMSFTKYKALGTIKFDSRLDNNIFAVIDYDEEEQTVKVTVLKKYNDETVTENEIAAYMVKYNKWRKQSVMIG